MTISWTHDSECEASPHQLLQAPDGTYSAIIEIPESLIRTFGASNVRKSLKTKSLEEASALLPFVAVAATMEFEEIDGELRCAAAGWATEQDSISIDWPGSEPGRLDKESLVARLMEACHPNRIPVAPPLRLEAPETRKLMKAADDLIVDFGIKIARLSPGYWRLCFRLDRLRHGSIAPFDGDFDHFPTPVLRRRHDDDDISLFELITRFEQEMSGRWSSARRRQYHQAFESIIKIFTPETSVRSLNRADFKRVRDILENLAPYWGTRRQTRFLPIEAAAKRCRELDLPRPSIHTVNHFIHIYHRIMDFAVAEGVADRNCVVLLVRRNPVEQLRTTRPFDLAQLQAIFTAPTYFQNGVSVGQRSAMFWMPLISLWGGLRLSECAQLLTEDIKMIGGVPVFHVRPRPNDNPEVA